MNHPVYAVSVYQSPRLALNSINHDSDKSAQQILYQRQFIIHTYLSYTYMVPTYVYPSVSPFALNSFSTSISRRSSAASWSLLHPATPSSRSLLLTTDECHTPNNNLIFLLCITCACFKRYNSYVVRLPYT